MIRGQVVNLWPSPAPLADEKRSSGFSSLH